MLKCATLMQMLFVRQLPPTQTRGRGVEGVFGSALVPSSMSSAASTSPPEITLGQQQSVPAAGIQHQQPDSMLPTAASGTIPNVPLQQHSSWPSVPAAQQHEQHQLQQQHWQLDIENAGRSFGSGGVRSASKGASHGYHPSQMPQLYGDRPSCSTHTGQLWQAPTAHSSPHFASLQAQGAMQSMPPQQWQRPPANAAQHLLNRMGHQGRGHSGQQGCQQLVKVSGGPPPSTWASPQGGPPSRSQKQPQQQQSHDKCDSPGKCNVGNHFRGWGRPFGNPPACQDQQKQGVNSSPQVSAGVSTPQSRGGWQGPGMQQQNEQQQQHQQQQGSAGPSGLRTAFDPESQAERLPGQVDCPEMPPGCSGLGSPAQTCAGARQVPAQSTSTPLSRSAGTPGTAQSTAHPARQNAAVAPGMQCKGVTQQSKSWATVSEHSAGLLHLGLVQEWLRADIAQAVAYLISKEVSYLLTSKSQ